MNSRAPKNPRLHASAADLLTLMSMPELMEARRLADLKADLKRAGYTQKDFDEVAIGWQREAEGEESPNKTTVMLRTADGQLVHVGIGSRGAYWLTVLAENPDAMTPAGRKAAAQYIRDHRAGLSSMFTEGPRFHEAADALLASEGAVVPLRQKTFSDRIRDLFGNKDISA